MATRTGRVRDRVYQDEEILDLLRNSDFDDSGDDDSYMPNRESKTSSSSSDSDANGDENSEEEIAGRETCPVNRGIIRGRRQCRGRVRGVSSVQRRNRGSNNSNSDLREWRQNTDIVFENAPLVEPNYLPFGVNENYSKFDYIKHYIGEDIYELITVKTNQTYVQKTGKSLNLTLRETKIYFAITIIMSCINYPVIRMYWEKKWRTPIIANAMSRDRFFAIRNSIKLVYDDDVSNEAREKDKLWKVRPIFDSVLNGCMEQVPEQQISIDEMIIPFSGSCGMKQYCPNKPNPVGLKVFILANPDGIVCNMVVYQGKTTFPFYTNAGFGLGESAVLYLTERLVPGTIIYFDRYFTTVKLANELLSKDLKCAGTLMKNRVPSGAKDILLSDSTLKKKGRGSYDVLTNTNNTIAITKWMDNKPVILLSTAHAAIETDQCSRWCKKEKTYVQIVRPEVIKQYNSKMGGVDMADRLLAVCPARARTKKWTLRFISHMVDLAICNSWLHFKKTELARGIAPKKVQQLRYYKMQFVEKMLEENLLIEQAVISDDLEEEQPTKRPPGRLGAVLIPSKRNRMHGNIHLPGTLDKQSRCRQKGCDKKSTIKCIDCNVALCLNSARNCFKAFHLED